MEKILKKFRRKGYYVAYFPKTRKYQLVCWVQGEFFNHTEIIEFMRKDSKFSQKILEVNETFDKTNNEEIMNAIIQSKIKAILL